MDYSQRLQEAMAESGDLYNTPTKLAKAVGCSSQAISNVFNGSTRSLSAKNHNKACKILGINPAWLESGELPKRATTGIVDIYVKGDDYLAVSRYVVPVMDAAASMGRGIQQPDSDTVVDNIRLTKSWVDSHLHAISSPDNLAVLSAYGDSMSPTFSDGDLLLVDRGVGSIKLDAVYVLALNGELFVKRVQRNIIDGSIIIKSDNPLYDPIAVTNGEREGLQILGRVVWAWNGKKL